MFMDWSRAALWRKQEVMICMMYFEGRNKRPGVDWILIGNEWNRKVKDDLYNFDLSNWMNGITVYWKGRKCFRNRLERSETKGQVWDGCQASEFVVVWPFVCRVLGRLMNSLLSQIEGAANLPRSVITDRNLGEHPQKALWMLILKKDTEQVWSKLGYLKVTLN